MVYRANALRHACWVCSDECEDLAVFPKEVFLAAALTSSPEIHSIASSECVAASPVHLEAFRGMCMCMWMTERCHVFWGVIFAP